MYIVYLPPNINDNFEKDNSDDSCCLEHRVLDCSRDPQTTVKRIHKSMGSALIIYEIESTSSSSEDTGDCSVFHVPTQITAVSSQLDAAQVRAFYFDLNFTPIDCIAPTVPAPSVSLFGVLVGMSRRDATATLACTELVVFDFEVGRRVVVKLWRGLAAWYSSLSLGCRLQIRFLTTTAAKSPPPSNSNDLHSSSATEIHLLAHGPGGKGKPVSGRAGMLHEKEAIILNFLNHQSLLIPRNKAPPSSTTLKNFCLASPLYLEFSGNNPLWTLQTGDTPPPVTVNFTHLDAKVWQKLLEFIDKMSSPDFSIRFNNLVQSAAADLFDFTADSSFDLFPSTLPSSPTFKSLDWADLCSSQVILYGVYSLKSLVERSNSFYGGGSSEESLGNLSILPQSMEAPFSVKLRCPHDDKYFIYPENNGAFLDEASGSGSGSGSKAVFSLLVAVRTILNDGNVDEIIRKSVYIIK